ncbi:MAG: Smr/MutS family protein, partial [Chitinophagaceae bacterium]
MKFEIGDKVLLLHSGEEGIIVEELNREMVKVDVKGVAFPVYIDQIDFPYFKNFTERKLSVKKQEIIPGEFLPVEKAKPIKRKEKGVFLSFLPEYDHSVPDTLIQTLKIYLINETLVNYHFDYSLLLNNHLGMEVKNDLRPFTNFYLQDLPFESLNDHPKFELIFSLKEQNQAKAGNHQV